MRIGKATFATQILAANDPTTNNEFTAKRAQDSMNMVAMVLYNPPIPVQDPVATRTALPCRTSRRTIIRVRVTLSDTEIEKSVIMGTVTDAQPEITNRRPIATLLTLALSVTAVRGILKYALTELRNMRQGRAITHRFMEWIT